MPNRLKKLTRTTSPMRQPRVEFFDVTCGCGRALSGQRLPRPQAVECPGCGEGLFVLPNDAYPPASLLQQRSGWSNSPRGRASFPDGWLGGAIAVAAHLTSGRLLLVALLATMTASLSFAFWIDAQSRRKSEPATAMPVRASGGNLPVAESRVPRPIAPAEPMLTGRIQNGAVLIDAPVDIPDGTRVSIRVIPAAADPPVLTSGEATR